jgi:hypothetical protein
MERKMQQLTKVIYHLNAKGDEAGDVGDQANAYENEIEGILRDAGERVKRFQAACAHGTDKKVIADKVHEVEVKYEMQKQRALKEVEDFKRRAKEAQILVKQEADSRIAAMAKELDGARKEFAQRVREFGEVTGALEKKAGEAAKGEKKRAATELADIVRKHNAKYNDMLQQRLAEEDAMKASLEKEHSKQLTTVRTCVRGRGGQRERERAILITVAFSPPCTAVVPRPARGPSLSPFLLPLLAVAVASCGCPFPPPLLPLLPLHPLAAPAQARRLPEGGRPAPEAARRGKAAAQLGGRVGGREQAAAGGGGEGWADGGGGGGEPPIGARQAAGRRAHGEGHR